MTQRTKSTDECGTSECPICHGTGWELFFGEDGNEYARECDCGLRARQIQESRKGFAAIPTTYKEITLKDITLKYYEKPESKALFKTISESIKNYLGNLDEFMSQGKGMYFWSNTKGSGKTMLATAIMNELINKHKKTVKFATSLDILDEIKATYDGEGSEKRLLSDITSSDVLVIDDFGTERKTDWTTERFYQIVNRRYVDKKVTFYTSNYDLNTLNYDDRITNRIRERSFVVHFPEESVREVKAKKENNIGGKA